jgi:hypothetical protein
MVFMLPPLPISEKGRGEERGEEQCVCEGENVVKM